MSFNLHKVNLKQCAFFVAVKSFLILFLIIKLGIQISYWEIIRRWWYLYAFYTCYSLKISMIYITSYQNVILRFCHINVSNCNKLQIFAQFGPKRYSPISYNF